MLTHCCCCETLLLLLNTTRKRSGPPSTRASIAVDGGVADTTRANTTVLTENPGLASAPAWCPSSPD